MKQILKDMIKVYQPRDMDWLGFKINKENPYSYHHIFKNVYGDYSDVIPNYKWINGAILSKEGQAYIHSFETKDNKYYNELNSLLRELNETNQPPTKEHWKKLQLIKDRHYETKK